MNGEGTEQRATGRPSALDDLATVWAAWFARRTGAWTAGLGFAAAVAVFAAVPGWPAFVVVAAALDATRTAPDRRVRAPILVFMAVAALALPEVVVPDAIARFDEPVPALALRAGTAVALAAAVFGIVRARELTSRGALVAVLVASAGAEVALPNAPWSPFLAASSFAFLAALASQGTVLPLVAGLVPAAVVTWQASGDGAHSLILRHASASAGIALGVVVTVRAVRRGAPTPGEHDAASARLAARVQRRPWTTAFVSVVSVGALEPAGSAGSLPPPGPNTAGSLATPFAAIAAAGERTFWSAARFLVSCCAGLLVYAALTIGLMDASFLGSGERWLVIFGIGGGSFVYLALAWWTARTHRAGPPGRLLVVLSCAVALVVGALAADQGFAGRTATIVSVGAWVMIGHRLAIHGRSGAVVTIAWVLSSAFVAVSRAVPRTDWMGGGFVYLLGRDPDVWAVVGDSAMSLVASGFGALNAVVALAAARRVRSMTLVPDAHPLVTDFAVDRP